MQLRAGKSASDSFAALPSGVADAACLTLDEMPRARAAEIPLSVALVFDESTGADMVLARPGIAKPTDLVQPVEAMKGVNSGRPDYSQTGSANPGESRRGICS